MISEVKNNNNRNNKKWNNIESTIESTIFTSSDYSNAILDKYNAKIIDVKMS